MKEVNMILSLKPSTKEWLEERADIKRRSTKREAEQIIEDAKKRDR